MKYRQRVHPGLRGRKSGVALLLACALLLPTVRADVTAAQVKHSLDKAVRVLKKEQLRDGTWAEQRQYAGGETCLVTLALLQAGEPPTSPAMQAALENTRRLPDQYVYIVALKIMALAKADPAMYRPEIEASARWLMSVQTESGLWSYDERRGTYDHSNTQFALLGLHAAAQAEQGELRVGVERV